MAPSRHTGLMADRGQVTSLIAAIKVDVQLAIIPYMGNFTLIFWTLIAAIGVARAFLG